MCWLLSLVSIHSIESFPTGAFNQLFQSMLSFNRVCGMILPLECFSVAVLSFNCFSFNPCSIACHSIIAVWLSRLFTVVFRVFAIPTLLFNCFSFNHCHSITVVPTLSFTHCAAWSFVVVFQLPLRWNTVDSLFFIQPFNHSAAISGQFQAVGLLFESFPCDATMLPPEQKPYRHQSFCPRGVVCSSAVPYHLLSWFLGFDVNKWLVYVLLKEPKWEFQFLCCWTFWVIGYWVWTFQLSGRQAVMEWSFSRDWLEA